MITDSQTNFIYLADTLSKMYPEFYNRFLKLLNDLDIESALLKNTKDVWAVDYMPIQVRPDKFILFNYKPGYLTKKYDHLRTNQQGVIDWLGINGMVMKSNLILDGGNLIKSSNKAIVSKRVLIDNKRKTENEIKSLLIELLELEDLIFIPDPDDLTGHADGVVRFYSDDQVLVNNEDSAYSKEVERALKKANLETIRIPYFESERLNSCGDQTANGCYINFLETRDCVIVPTFNNAMDDRAVEKFESLYSSTKKVVSCDSREIAEYGGVLNCISWNVQMWKPILEDQGEYYLIKN